METYDASIDRIEARVTAKLQDSLGGCRNANEMLRVFYDRLVDDDDRLWFLERMKLVTQEQFGISMDDLFKDFDFNESGDVDDDDVRYLLYSSYTDPKASKKKYKRVRDLERLH